MFESAVSLLNPILFHFDVEVVKYRSETNKADTVTETEEAPASTATVTFELKRKPDDGDKSSRIGNNWM